jgi:hypothetical protein
MSHACAADWKLILEYLKVLLSWPVVVGIGVFVGTRWFKSELSGLINRIASVKFPGGELVTQQAKMTEDIPAAAAAEAHQVAAVEAEAPQALDDPHLPEEIREQLRGVFTAERVAARTWEYRYLNYFFAPDTQHVLDWLIGLNQTTTYETYNTFWIYRVPAAGERQAIIHALQMHLCIVIDGPGITEKGKEYAAWPERKILSMPRVPE